MTDQTTTAPYYPPVNEPNKPTPCPNCGHCPTCGRGSPTYPTFQKPVPFPGTPWFPYVWCGTGSNSIPPNTFGVSRNA